MNFMAIEKVIGRQILDSRGNPTVEAEIILSGGYKGRGMAPSGASTGQFEAHELRDGDSSVYNGKGVRRAMRNINTVINDTLVGMEATNIFDIDTAMIELDGTDNKSKLGANAILAVSIATANAACNALEIPLYRYIGGISVNTLPVPMMNIINGGAHVAKVGNGGLDTQEFMIMPVGANSFKEAVRTCTEVYHQLARLLKADGYSTAVGDEGGFAPMLESDEAAIEYIINAVKEAGYKIGKEYGKEADFMIAMDAAASEWKGQSVSEMMEAEHKITGQFVYKLPKSGKTYTTDQLIEHWTQLVDKYPIISIEDPLDEEDWEGWKKITRQLGDRVQLVGDDLFVTNTRRLEKGIEEKCGNSILIKVNQIGSLSETIDAIKLAHKSGYTAIASHRSGETEDTTIADLAVGMCTGMIKTGAPCRSERVAKYNQLIRIEEELGKNANYPGMKAFNVLKY